MHVVWERDDTARLLRLTVASLTVAVVLWLAYLAVRDALRGAADHDLSVVLAEQSHRLGTAWWLEGTSLASWRHGGTLGHYGRMLHIGVERVPSTAPPGYDVVQIPGGWALYHTEYNVMVLLTERRHRRALTYPLTSEPYRDARVQLPCAAHPVPVARDRTLWDVLGYV